MGRPVVRPGSGAERFIRVYRRPELAAGLGLAEWDVVVRVGRAARLLGSLGARLERQGLIHGLPAPVRAHLDSDLTLARFQRQVALFELRELGRTLVPLGVPLVALKGCGYLLQGLAMSEGRMFADVDVLVPRADLDRVEQALLGSGWETEKLDPYDQHYYRAWMHELAPLRFPGRNPEVDVHHTILPLTSRLRPNAEALFDSALPVAGSPWQVLCPEDQVLHACAHLFHDSDCSDKLRELADLDALIREFAPREGFWPSLAARAHLHELGRPLWYALTYSAMMLGTPVPADALNGVPRATPAGPVRTLMEALVPDALLPAGPDATPTLATRAKRALLFLRSHWLRMPPWLLAWHAANKALRGLKARKLDEADAGGPA